MTEVAEAPKAQAPKKEARVLTPQRLGLAEQMRQDWCVNAEEGTTIEQILDPQYWAHVAAQFQPFDRIDVRLETGEWMVELLVVNTGRNWAQVHKLHEYELVKRAERVAAAEKHRVEWKGPQRKHVVVRLADQVAVQEGFSTKAEAEAWLVTYENKVTS